jgi:rod shape-determining protein MreB
MVLFLTFEVTEQMLRYCDRQSETDKFTLLKPRVIVGILRSLQRLKEAVKDATKSAGAREVFLIEEPMAASIGARSQLLDLLVIL